MGRPPGALNGGVRRRHLQDWELRDPRFQEIYSDEEEDDERGVLLDPNSSMARDARARGGFAGDELYFDGYDIGRDRISRRGMYDLYGDELAYRDQEGIAYQASVREKEEELIDSALARIRRARAKGKTNVNLSEEEMEALERRRDPQPEPPKPALASPPPTPAKAVSKTKASSRSNSSKDLASKARKRNSGLFGSSPSPAKSNSKAKVSRKNSDERALTYPAAQARMPPNGVPAYAQMGYYGPLSPEFSRSQPSSKAPSRTTSKSRRRDSIPADRADTYSPPGYPPRYYPPPAMRPESSGSNRSLPDDVDWYPPAPRHRSNTNVQYSPYPTDYDSAPNLPAAQTRRQVSGPPDVRYANLRRNAPPPPAAAARPPPQHSSRSDPAMGGRKSSGLSREIGEDSSSESSTGSSEDEGDGVQVDFEPRDGGYGTEYEIVRAPPPEASRNEGRKRRTTGRR